MKNKIKLLFNMAVGFGLMAINAHAAAVSQMPWDTPITSVADSVTGPVAYGMTIGGGACAAWGAMHHGEMSTFMQKAGIVALAGVAMAKSPAVLAAIGVTGGLI